MRGAVWFLIILIVGWIIVFIVGLIMNFKKSSFQPRERAKWKKPRPTPSNTGGQKENCYAFCTAYLGAFGAFGGIYWVFPGNSEFLGLGCVGCSFWSSFFFFFFAFVVMKAIYRHRRGV